MSVEVIVCYIIDVFFETRCTLSLRGYYRDGWLSSCRYTTSVSNQTNYSKSTQPCISPESLKPVPDLIGWSKSGNVYLYWVASITLCDPIWRVSSRSGEACLRTMLCLLYFASLHFVPPPPVHNSPWLYTCTLMVLVVERNLVQISAVTHVFLSPLIGIHATRHWKHIMWT